MKFKAIVYTNKSDKLTFAVVHGQAAWDKKYVQLFAKSINCDQSVHFHGKDFDSETAAIEAAKAEIKRLRAPFVVAS